MNQPPAPPPEGVLIESARREARLSVREAARRAGISEGWWRQVVKGYQSLSGGAYGTVQGVPAETVAKMARAAGVTPEQMATEGRRPDAAEVMREPVRRETAPPPRREDGPSFTPEMLVALAPYLQYVKYQIKVAEREYPGEPLTGAMVFGPGSREAEIWDAGLAAGIDRAVVEQGVATLRVWAEQKAAKEAAGNGIAAGLLRGYSARHGRNPSRMSTSRNDARLRGVKMLSKVR